MGGPRLLSVALLLSLIVGIKAQALGPQQQGVVTFYGGPQRSEWPYWQATAISSLNPVYGSGNPKGCGACIQATCTSGCKAGATPLTVLVTDTCDSCATNQLNIHASAFETHFQNDLSNGQILVQWQQVACDPPGNIIAEVVDSRSTDGGFMAVALLDVAGSGVIKLIEFMGQGSGWRPMTNQYGAVWQISQFGSPPFSLRITGGSGQVLTAMNAITAVTDGEYPTSVQFGSGGTGPPPTQVPSTSPPTAPQSGVPPPSGGYPPTAIPPTNTASSPPPPSPRVTTVRRTPSSPSNNNATAPAANATAPAANATAPAANATAPAESAASPAEEVTASPEAAPSASPEAAPSASEELGPSPAMGPDETQLTVNSNLTGRAAAAAKEVANPTISIAGRRRV